MSSDVILLIASAGAAQVHAALLRGAGFRVEVATNDISAVREVLMLPPAMIAIEVEPMRSVDIFDFARRLRAHPELRATPILVYATALNADHVEMAARSGLLWLQIAPVDKLLAAVRGLLSARECAGGPHH